MTHEARQQTAQTAQAPADRHLKNMGPGQVEQTLELASEKSDRSLLHPASGLVILGLDWILFGGTVVTGGLGLALMCLLGFLVGGGVIFLIQNVLTSDNPGKSLGKGVVGGLLIGVPTPIVGTVAGFAVLAVSGLSRLLKK